MAYLYRHIRLDNNEPFYIGIGEDKDLQQYKYNRAYSKFNRNKHWKNIVALTPYEVEIIIDDLTWEEACNKEIEFITMYGRSILNSGSLCNIVDGGEGAKGNKHSEETKQFLKEYIRTKETKEKMSISAKGHTRNIGKKHSQKTKDIIKNKITGRILSVESKLKIGVSKKGHPGYKKGYPILQYGLNNTLIKEWSSIKEASDILNIDDGQIVSCLKGRLKTAKKFVWKYKNNSI
jgi:hypothetical protein